LEFLQNHSPQAPNSQVHEFINGRGLADEEIPQKSQRNEIIGSTRVAVRALRNAGRPSVGSL
jgi:hypothetical protein